MTGAMPAASARPELDSLRTDVAVVVLNTHHSGLGIARNLGPLGIRVIGLTADASFPGNRSRWLQYRRAPDSFTEGARLLEFLVDLAAELGHRAVLLPTRDLDILFINQHRAALEAAFRIPFSAPETIERVMNKDRLFEIARGLGMALPRGSTVRGWDDLHTIDSLRYPCICKPLYASQWRKPDVWRAVGRRKAVQLASRDEFMEFYERVVTLDPVVTVQEWIPGGETALNIFGSYCDADHRVIAYFTARKRLQWPPLIGTGIVVEALPVDAIVEASKTLLQTLQFHGISEIEFKIDARDGRAYLIEINPRHWDQHRLGVAVGVNLSEALYRDITGQPPRAMSQGADSACWIADPEYVRHVLRCLVGREAWTDAWSVLGKARTYAVFDRRDMRPWLAMLGLRNSQRPLRKVASPNT